MENQTSGGAMSAADQLMKLDPSTMVAIVRDLEHKLTEYQRQDKPPAWAVALDQRLEQLEKWRLSGGVADVKAGGASTNATSSGPVHQTLAEDKLIAKMRSDIDAAVGGLHLQLDSKVSACSLEVDRIFKLLQIRPTNADLQQIVVSVRGIESKTQSQLDEIQNNLMSVLRDNLSQEMLNLVDELRSGSSKADEHQNSIRTQLRDYSRELADVRSIATQNHEALVKELQQLRSTAAQTSDTVKSNKIELDKDLVAVRVGMAETKESVLELRQLQAEERSAREAALQAAAAASQAQAAALEKALEQANEEITSAKSNILDVESDLLHVKHQFSGDMRDVQATVENINTILSEEQKRMRNMVKYVEEFTALDFPSKLAKHEDRLNKLAFDVNDLNSALHHTVAGELKTINKLIHVLQEQVNSDLPARLAESNGKIEELFRYCESTSHAVDMTKMKLQSTQELVDGLLPLKEQAKVVADALIMHDQDIKSLKEAVAANIDANDEFVRRLEELEESLDNMDNSITDRMNRIRDTLMDTLLEKQSETTQQVMHVTQNLEAMSMAGEPGVPAPFALGSTRSSAVQMYGAPVQDAPMDMNAVAQQAGLMSSTRRTNSMGGNMSIARGAPTSFKRPTMLGAMVSGQSSSNLLQDDPPVQQQSQQQQLQAAPSSSGGSGILGKKRATRPSSQQFNILSSFSDNATDDGDDDGSRRSVTSAAGGVRAAAAAAAAAASVQAPPSSRPSSRGGALPMSSSSGSAPNSAPPSRQRVSFTGHDSPPRSESPPREERSYASTQSVVTNTYVPTNSSPMGSPNRVVVALPAVAASEFAVGPQAAADQWGGRAQSAGQQIVNNARAETLTAEYGALTAANAGYPHLQEAQFMADLCVSFEEISLKRKRVAQVPPIMCKSLVDVLYNVAEFVANSADFEMVEAQLQNITGSTAIVQEIVYDEGFVLTRRQQRTDEFLDCVLHMVSAQSQQPGILRMDARTLFFAMMKKAIEMFLTKHNQVLVAGNSRLGRVKIPTCIACDRPLIDKVKLDHFSGPSIGNSSLLEDDPATPRSMAQHNAGQNLAVFNSASKERPRTSSALFHNSSIASSLQSSSTSDLHSREGQGFVLKSGFKMPKKPHKTPPL